MLCVLDGDVQLVAEIAAEQEHCNLKEAKGAVKLAEKRFLRSQVSGTLKSANAEAKRNSSISKNFYMSVPEWHDLLSFASFAAALNMPEKNPFLVRL